ncbi:MAG: hypothetical protein KC420_00370 [Myxococcales bacterium]|nr:hypothetical protein [Myxococcales bacterium]
MDDTPSGNLLLYAGDERRPIADEAVSSADAGAMRRPDDTAKLGNLLSDRDHIDDLAKQRWGVIAPEGPEGDRLIEAMRPLLERRREQCGLKEDIVYRVPPGQDASEAIAWRKRHFATGIEFRDDLPRYQLILGDLHQVSADLQAVQSIDGLVGRVAFDRLDDYAAYAAKVLASEGKVVAGERRMILHTVHDGSAATQVGHRELIEPSRRLLERQRQRSADLRDVALVVSGSDDPTPDELYAEACRDDPAVLFSVSHGEGAGRRGWSSAETQRLLQGRMVFGPYAEAIDREALSSGKFIPGGLWLMFACFSAGTPASSKFERWLRELNMSKRDVAEALRSLPAAGERPFVAALPKAALLNPEGPIAFVGHVDLAWTYSFRPIEGDKAQSRPARFGELVRAAITGSRVGVAFRELYGLFTEIDSELASLELNPKATASRRGHLWMLRQDLAGFMLLGDPAARLPGLAAAPAAKPAAKPVEQRQSLFGVFGFDVVDGGGASQRAAPRRLTLAELERAVSRVLAGEGAAAVARSQGVDAETLTRQVDRYIEAGRRALRDAGDV